MHGVVASQVQDPAFGFVEPSGSKSSKFHEHSDLISTTGHCRLVAEYQLPPERLISK